MVTATVEAQYLARPADLIHQKIGANLLRLRRTCARARNNKGATEKEAPTVQRAGASKD
jgi:hypothetical protein